MEKILTTDDRKTAIRKFDGCMEEFFSATKQFVSQIKHIRNSDEDKMKIYTLGYNYYTDTKLVAENTISYLPYISQSLLTLRFDYHDELRERIGSELAEAKMYCMSISQSEGIGLDNEPEQTQSVVLVKSEIEQVQDGLSTVFTNHCSDIFGGILKNLGIIEENIVNLRFVNQRRNDDVYEQLFMRTRSEYYASDLWENVKNNFIEHVYKSHFRFRKPDEEKLYNLRAALDDELANHEIMGALWSAYSENNTMMARKIAELELQDYTHINQLFFILGKIGILDDWIDELHYEQLPYEVALDEFDVRTTVDFIKPWNERKFRGVWRQVYDYMMENKDADYAWCCLQHTMTFYNMIEDTEFCFFMKWLNRIHGEDLISETNMRQVKKDYFVMTRKSKWNIDHMRNGNNELGIAGKNSSQAEKKFNLYCKICTDLTDILKDYISSHR